MKVLLFSLLLTIFMSTCTIGQDIISSGRLAITVQDVGDGVHISSIQDNGRELLNTTTSTELFTLFISNPPDSKRKRIRSSGDWGSVTISNNGADCSIVLTDPHITNLPKNLTATITIVTSGAQSQWDLSVTGLDAWSLTDVYFPHLNIKAEGDDYFLLPHYAGILAKEPKANPVNFNEIYPRGWGANMQFLAYYNDTYGLYFGFHDPQASLKTFRVKTESGGVILEGKLPIPNKTVSGNEWDMPGHFELDLYDGDWYDASMIYKEWVSTKADYWPQDDPARMERQNVLGSIGVWIYCWSELGFSVPGFTAELKANAEFFSGIPLGFHWYEWNYVEFDNDYPDYFPEIDEMSDIVYDMQESGDVYMMPYINGRMYDTDLADYEKNGYPYATKKSNGTPYYQTFSGNQFAVMCPTQEPWQDIIIETCEEITERIGTAGIYIDQVCASTPEQCMDPTHNHPLGGGHWWRDGYKEMFARIHTTLSDEKFVTVEGGVDYLADQVDGFLVEGWTTNNMVPAFPAVYAGKVQLFGVKTSTGNYKNQTFYCKTAQALAFGIQPGRFSSYMVNDGNAKENAKPFVKRIATMRYKLADYMSFGKMLKPLAVIGDIPTITSTWTDYGDPVEVTISAVQSSVWRNAGDNKVAVIFVNASMTEELDFSFNFDAAYYGLTGELTIQKITEDNDGPLEAIDNIFSKKVTLQALDAAAYVISGTPVFVSDDNTISVDYTLAQNYPNPFNPTTVINFTIPAFGKTNLTIYNALGQRVATLADKNLPAGSYHYKFDATHLAPGLYFYKLQSNNYSMVKKMMLLK